jgi:hypothetical protein
MPKDAIDYTKTVIYKIIVKDSGAVLYVGSSTNFIQRKCRHKNNVTNEKSKDHNFKVYQDIRNLGGWDFVDMIMVEEYSDCENNLQRLKREREWIETLIPQSNILRPTITTDEYKDYQKQYRVETDYDKKYYEANKEIMIQKQIIRNKNSDGFKVYQKEYQAKNRAKMNEYMRDYRLKKKSAVVSQTEV